MEVLPAAIREDGHVPKRHPQVGVVEDQNAGEFANCRGEIGECPGETFEQFLGRHIMSALGDAHGNALLGRGGVGDSDKAENDPVTGLSGLL